MNTAILFVAWMIFALVVHYTSRYLYCKKQCNKLNEIWEIIQSAAYAQRINNSNTGKEFWQPLKNLLDNNDMGLKWRKHPPHLTTRMMALVNTTPTHFLRQQFRIPKEEDLTLRRLFQIALNIGQWVATWDDNVITSAEYEHYKLGSIYTYVDERELCVLAKELTPEMESFIHMYCHKTIIGERPWEEETNDECVHLVAS